MEVFQRDINVNNLVVYGQVLVVQITPLDYLKIMNSFMILILFLVGLASSAVAPGTGECSAYTQ